LPKLRNEIVSVELKNGTFIQRTVTTVEMSINTHLKEVKITVKNKDPVDLEKLFIRGSNICHYVLPDNLPLDRFLDDVSHKKKKSGRKKKAEKNFIRVSLEFIVSKNNFKIKGSLVAPNEIAFRGKGKQYTPVIYHRFIDIKVVDRGRGRGKRGKGSRGVFNHHIM
jgi:small nuclear ribonucleoprotein D1